MKNLKQLIKEINDGKNLEENLPIFAEKMKDGYFEMAILHFTFSYELIYELVTESEEEELLQVKPTLDCIHSLTKSFFLDSFDRDIIKQRLSQLEDERNGIIEKMKILVAYSDQLRNYEYILNRLQFRFEASEEIVDDVQFSDQLLDYIFEDADNMIKGERIKEVLEQLPVRMSRAKYLEWVKKSLLFYEGGDKSAADTYIYMLRTCAMVYKTEGMKDNFLNVRDFLNELKCIDYKNLTKLEYDSIREKIQDMMELIEITEDWYLEFQRLFNSLYVCYLAAPYVKKEENAEGEKYRNVIRMIYNLYLREGDSNDLEKVEQELIKLEGHQEIIFPDVEWMEGILEEICLQNKSVLEEIMLKNRFEELCHMSQLMSSSLFTSFFEQEEGKIANENHIKIAANSLVKEFTEFFNENQLWVRRAVMAHTMHVMPVMFQNGDEMEKYIENSLKQCKDISEKQASFCTLKEIMEDSNN